MAGVFRLWHHGSAGRDVLAMVEMENVFAEDLDEPSETPAADEELHQTDEDGLVAELSDEDAALGVADLDGTESLEALADSEADDDDGEFLPYHDDVEEDLDVMVRRQFSRTGEDEPDVEEPASTRPVRVINRDTHVLPREGYEFVCAGCFLVKHRRLLGDEERVLCKDCA